MRIVSDCLAITGAVFLVISLYRLVRHLGFFDLTIYGIKKLWEVIRTRNYGQHSSLGSFADYRNHNRYKQPYGKGLAIGAVLLFLSLVLAVLE